MTQEALESKNGITTKLVRTYSDTVKTNRVKCCKKTIKGTNFSSKCFRKTTKNSNKTYV